MATLAVFLLWAGKARAGGTNSTAARAWQALTNWAPLPTPTSWQTNPPTPEQLGKFDDQQAAHAGAFADRARDYYIRHAKEPNVPQARMMELQALQLAVHFGATNRLADLDRRERELLQDKTVPEQTRYELRLDTIGRELRARPAADAEMNAALEKAGRGLVREFPHGPAGYEILLTVAQSRNLDQARALGELMANSGGPAALTDIGKGLLRRLDALGKPLAIQFTTADGRAVNPATLSNQVVLVDFWATWCPPCMALVPEVKQLYRQFHTNGFEVVGINFDDDPGAAQRFIQEQGLVWPQYLGGRSNNKFGHEYSVNALPSVWLVDRAGNVRDLHGTENLRAKVEKLMAE
jgi:thiol-disulfide isomerase/thioredoxin